MYSIGKPKREGRRGASLVEMTLVLFLLLIILVGVLDFARAFYSYIVITNASREGARYGSKFSHDGDNIREWTKTEAAAGGLVLQDSDIDVDPDPSVVEPADPGNPITVTVSYDVDTILGHIVGFDTVPLQARTRMVVFWKDDSP